MWVQSEDAFFADYAASHKKLSELGFTPSKAHFAFGPATVAVGIALIVVAICIGTEYIKDTKGTYISN